MIQIVIVIDNFVGFYENLNFREVLFTITLSSNSYRKLIIIYLQRSFVYKMLILIIIRQILSCLIK